MKKTYIYIGVAIAVILIILLSTGKISIPTFSVQSFGGLTSLQCTAKNGQCGNGGILSSCYLDDSICYCTLTSSSQCSSTPSGCTPWTFRCSGNMKQYCDASGSWIDSSACPSSLPECYKLSDGGVGCRAATNGECIAGNRRCDGNMRQICDITLLKWIDGSPCPSSTPECYQASSTGVSCRTASTPSGCTPWTFRCSGNMKQYCDASGSWIDSSACPSSLPECYKLSDGGVGCRASGECPGQTKCDDGTCKDDCGTSPVSDEVRFSVKIIDAPIEVDSEGTATITVEVTNNGGSKAPSISTLGDNTMKVEVGLLEDKELTTWGNVFALTNIGKATTSCVPSGTVITKIITLKPGEKTTEQFTIDIPSICGTFATEDYDFFVDAYINCFNTGEQNGLTSFQRSEVKVNPTKNILGVIGKECGSCTDDLLNGDETSVDCGGKDCDKCKKGYKCKINTDCEEGLLCDLTQKAEGTDLGYCKSEGDVDYKCPSIKDQDKCNELSKCYWGTHEQASIQCRLVTSYLDLQPEFLGIKALSKTTFSQLCDPSTNCIYKTRSLTVSEIEGMTKTELGNYACKESYECTENYCMPYADLPAKVKTNIGNNFLTSLFGTSYEGICVIKEEGGLDIMRWFNTWLEKLTEGDLTYWIGTILAFALIIAVFRNKK